MKKSKRKLVVAALVFFSISLLVASPVQAKAKKLKVNTVYTTTKKVKGITKLKKAKVVAKIGKKTYKAKSNSKGKFTIKIKKQKKGTKVKVIVYKGKKKYTKKTVKVKTIPWYQRKPFKGHKAAIASATDSTYGKVFNQYETDLVLYIKKGHYMKFTIGGKTYKSVAGDNKDNIIFTEMYSDHYGNMKPAGNKKVKIKVYKNSNNKLVESYTITPKKVKLPSKTAEIDYEQFLKDYDTVLKTGKDIVKDIGDYRYEISVRGYLSIGYPMEYMEHSANGSHVYLKAKNGATLYYTIGVKGNFNFEAPTKTKYDGIIKSGQTKKFEGWDFKEGELVNNNLYTKIYAYKNGKLVAIRATTHYLIQGYADWMFE